MAGNRRSFANLRVFGRLTPEATIEHAAAQVTTVAQRFSRDHPDVYRDNRGFTGTALGLLGELTHNARPLLLILLGTTALVLLLAAANVASLTVARTLNRERELALRTALGAGRRQLVAQLLTESVLLGAGGGLVGLVVASATVGTLSTFVGRFTARTADIALDGRVLAFTAVVSILTGLAFGTLPALVARPGAVSSLRQSGSASGNPRRSRLLRGLVVAQVAVSVVLLACAGLFLTSVYRLSRVDAGYHAERVLSAEVFGNFTRYATPEACLRLYEPLIARLKQVPGVQSVAVGTVVPLGRSGQPFMSPFLIEGRQASSERPAADVNLVSPAYFETLGIPIIGGRGFLPTDSHAAAKVVLVSQAMARYWDGRDPVGASVSFDNGEHWYSVVGIVGDVRQYGLEESAAAQAYLPLDQATFPFGAGVLIRTTAEPAAMGEILRDAVRAIDPDLPVEHIETLEALRTSYLARPRLTAILLALFAGLALVVTLAGLVGVIGTSVSQRTQEFGVRMALGARPGGILADVVRQGLTMVMVGLVVGGVLATFAARLLSTYLFETEPTDPMTFAAVGAALLVAGALACLGPARRATRVDPILALRSE